MPLIKTLCPFESEHCFFYSMMWSDIYMPDDSHLDELNLYIKCTFLFIKCLYWWNSIREIILQMTCWPNPPLIKYRWHLNIAWSSLIIWDETSCLIYSIVSWPNFTFQISDISYIIKQWVDFLFLDEVFVNVAFQDDDKFTGWRT